MNKKIEGTKYLYKIFTKIKMLKHTYTHTKNTARADRGKVVDLHTITPIAL